MIQTQHCGINLYLCGPFAAEPGHSTGSRITSLRQIGLGLKAALGFRHLGPGLVHAGHLSSPLPFPAFH